MNTETSELNRRIDEDSWAEKTFRSVPFSAQELRCKCWDDPTGRCFRPPSNEETPTGYVNGKWVCLICGKPKRYSLVQYLDECEICDGWYIIPEAPDKRKQRICAKCDAKIPTRRVAQRRTD